MLTADEASRLTDIIEQHYSSYRTPLGEEDIAEEAALREAIKRCTQTPPVWLKNLGQQLIVSVEFPCRLWLDVINVHAPLDQQISHIAEPRKHTQGISAHHADPHERGSVHTRLYVDICWAYYQAGALWSRRIGNLWHPRTNPSQAKTEFSLIWDRYGVTYGEAPDDEPVEGASQR